MDFDNTDNANTRPVISRKLTSLKDILAGEDERALQNFESGPGGTKQEQRRKRYKERCKLEFISRKQHQDEKRTRRGPQDRIAFLFFIFSVLNEVVRWTNGVW